MSISLPLGLARPFFIFQSFLLTLADGIFRVFGEFKTIFSIKEKSKFSR
jgi:hypothetical protein